MEQCLLDFLCFQYCAITWNQQPVCFGYLSTVSPDGAGHLPWSPPSWHSLRVHTVALCKFFIFFIFFQMRCSPYWWPCVRAVTDQDTARSSKDMEEEDCCSLKKDVHSGCRILKTLKPTVFVNVLWGGKCVQHICWTSRIHTMCLGESHWMKKKENLCSAGHL